MSAAVGAPCAVFFAALASDIGREYIPVTTTKSTTEEKLRESWTAKVVDARQLLEPV